MGRPRKKPLYVVISAEILGCIGEDRVLDFETEPEKPMIDELQCPVADEVLIALRKAFSLTYPRNPFVDGMSEALTEIRRIGTEALREIPEVLDELGLKPIPLAEKEKGHHRAHVFQFSLVRAKDLRVKVKYEGRTSLLVNLADPIPADGLIQTLRQIVSDTFSEMHGEEQYGAVLLGIREQIWSILPEFNALLQSIEIEPIADRPTEREVENE